MNQCLKQLWDYKEATQPLEFICLNSDSHSGRTADCVGMKKKIMYMLSVIVRDWHAKDKKTLGCMLLKPKDLENMNMNVPIISLVANTRLGVVP